MSDLSDYDYDLPPELVAQEPLPHRDDSRLLVVRRSTGTWEHRDFREVGRWLGPGDLLVLNETRVFPARLRARRASGGKVEVFLLRPEATVEQAAEGSVEKDPAKAGSTWEVLARPARALDPGRECTLEAEPVTVRSLGRRDDRVLVELRRDGRPLSGAEAIQLCERVGEVPLPPYVRRAAGERRRSDDRERYQTVYARNVGAVAAPTAGLHFTPEILESLRAAGADVVRVTLHVGHGTFKPLTEAVFRSTRLHEEDVEIDAEAGRRILEARSLGRRIVAIGTTSLRAIECFLASGDQTSGLTSGPASGPPFRKRTDLFVKPGHEFLGTGALLTNFHLPRSSLLLLACAFAGRDLILAAYADAIRERYRFYSYGDAMLIL